MSPALSKKNSVYNGRRGGVKVLVATGASGGHIFPALGFIDALKERYEDIDILLVLPRSSLKLIIALEEGRGLPQKNIKNQIENFGYKVNYISISAIKLSLDFKNMVSILNFFKGTFESIFILLRFQPDIVVGFGSLVCIPLVLFAWAFRIKTLIHEQNVIPGLANRFLAKFSDGITVSFEQTKGYLKNNKKKIVTTGNPIRKQLIQIDKNKALDFLKFSDTKITILVMGGSLGSHKINLAFLKAISELTDKSKLQIIHLSGLSDYELLRSHYRDSNVNVRLFSFLKPMQYAYSASDLVISRGGATTISEIVYFRLPAIIIPYPYAYKHQLSNAKILEEKGSAIIIKDEELDADILRKTIESLMNNPDKLKNMRSGYNHLTAYNAGDLLVKEVNSHL